ncbi:MAG: hypothetical protein EOO60_02000 [Hymenobacter sp.]|nr:MAG: hypothetical protein EOO60_02000 [Hymenobacter sp.]
MKSYLPLAGLVLLLSSCAKEDVAPAALAPRTTTAHDYASDYTNDPRGTGRSLGAADANRFAASYSIGGDMGSGTSSGGFGSTTTGLPPSYPGYSTPGSGPYGGSPSGTFVDPDFGGNYGIGGGVDYGPGLVLPHNYAIPGNMEAAFERDLQGLKDAAQAHYNTAAANNDQNEVLFWDGYIEGVNNYMLY